MKNGSKIVIRQTRGLAGRDPAVRSTIKALGLGRIGKEKQHVVNAAIAGMIRRVEHLVEISPVK